MKFKLLFHGPKWLSTGYLLAGDFTCEPWDPFVESIIIPI